MRVEVDPARCDVQALCVGYCPAVFGIDDQYQIAMLIEEPSETMRADVTAAARKCPTQAIRIVG